MGSKKYDPVVFSCFNEKEREYLSAWNRFTQSDEWDYVIFLARRSYVLATLLAKQECINLETNKKTVYLTDAAFFLRCKELAEYYIQNHYFPRILICDDIFIHGRSFNHYLTALEERICEFLSCQDYELVREEFSRAVTIYACLKSQEPLFLLGRYKSRFKYVKKVSPRIWRNMSNSITNFIADNNTAYAVYVYSEYISQEQFEKIDTVKEKLIRTNYQNSVEYTWVECLGTGNNVKAVFTLRIKKNKKTEGYRVIPLIFMPNLSEDVTLKILKEILSKSGKNASWIRWLKEWYTIPGKRSFNELLTLILSNTILQEFIKKNNIFSDENYREREIRKISRNYNQTTLSETEHILMELLDKEFFDLDGLKIFLYKIIPNDTVLLNCNMDERNIIEQFISQNIDNYFYDLGVKEEKEVVKMYSMNYLSNKSISQRRVNDCRSVFNKLFSGKPIEYIEQGIRYFLQMMDAGVIAISSYASNGMDICGFVQFAKNGEQSLLIKPLEMYEYIPMLDLMWQKCIQWGWSIRDELIEFYNSPYWKSESKSIQELEKLLNFITDLQEMGQEPEDWCGNFFERITTEKVYDYENKINNRVRVMKNQYEIFDWYIRYLRSRNL